MRAISYLECKEKFDDDQKFYVFSGPCTVTGVYHAVTVPDHELFAFRQTDRISEFKSLSRDDREFLISGTSPLGWDILFGPDNSDK